MVADGREAVDLAVKGGFDAVLMDLDIPGLDGIAAIRAIRAIRALPRGTVPIIANTGSALPDDIARCRAARMYDRLPKPVNPVALTRVLGRLTVAPAGGASTVRPTEVKSMAGTVGLTSAYRAAVALEPALRGVDGADAGVGIERLRARREDLAPVDAVELGW